MAKVSELRCGSGSAWVGDKVMHFRDYREIKRGKNKGCYEILIVKGMRFYRKKWRPKLKKVIVPADSIKYFPRPGRKRRRK